MIVETVLRRKGTEAATLAPEASLSDVAALLAGEQFEIVIACDADRNILGVITDTDIMRHVAGCDQPTCACAVSVADAMTTEVVTCKPDDDLRQVWKVMNDSVHRRIPVVDTDGRLSGVINIRDVFQFLNEEKQLEKREILHFLTPPPIRGEPMSDVLETLRQEHFRIGAVLACLRHLAAGTGDGHRKPETDLLFAILDYMEAFSDTIHHPKEEAYLFKALQRRKPDEAEVLDKMIEEHATGVTLLSEVRSALQSFHNKPRNVERFRSAVDYYVQFERAHLHREENDFMPLAARYLAAEDWRRIRDAFTRDDDPLFGAERRAEYDKLFEYILDHVPDAPVFRFADG